MAKVTNAVASYDTPTNREDLAAAVYRISPVDTPFVSAVPRAKASAPATDSPVPLVTRGW